MCKAAPRGTGCNATWRGGGSRDAQDLGLSSALAEVKGLGGGPLRGLRDVADGALKLLLGQSGDKLQR